MHNALIRVEHIPLALERMVLRVRHIGIQEGHEHLSVVWGLQRSSRSVKPIKVMRDSNWFAPSAATTLLQTAESHQAAMSVCGGGAGGMLSTDSVSPCLDSPRCASQDQR